MPIKLPSVPGIAFAYDARQGLTFEPVEATGEGLFDFAVGSVEDISGHGATLTRRKGGPPPNDARQIPFNPQSGFNGFGPPAYAPAFEYLAQQQTCLQTEHEAIMSMVGGFTASFVALAAMSAATPTEGRLLSYYGMPDPSGTDQGYNCCCVFARDYATNGIMTFRAQGNVGETFLRAPIELDRLYRFGMVMNETEIALYLDNVEVARAPQAPEALTLGKIALGGQANTFGEFIPLTWEGPIVFAMGINRTWSASERATVDAWIVKEFNL